MEKRGGGGVVRGLEAGKVKKVVGKGEGGKGGDGKCLEVEIESEEIRKLVEHMRGTMNKLVKYSEKVGIGIGNDIRVELNKLSYGFETMTRVMVEQEREYLCLKDALAKTEEDNGALKEELQMEMECGLERDKEMQRASGAGRVEILGTEEGMETGYEIPVGLQTAIKNMIAKALEDLKGVVVAGKEGVAGASYAKSLGGAAGKKKGKGVPCKIVEEIGCEDRPENIEVVRIHSKKEFPELRRRLVESVKPAESGVMVLGMKSSEGGTMALRVLGKEDSRSKFREELGRRLEEESIVRVRKRGYVQVNDLEDGVGEEEILARFGEVLGLGRGDMRVTSIASTGGGMGRRAIVRLPSVKARELAKTGYIKIGFVVSRVEIREFADRCYSCGATGHYAGTCKVIDKRGRCFRCGKEGHFARDCGKVLGSG